MRVAISYAFYCESEILMLDVSTSHLDLPVLIWFENFDYDFYTTIIIVPHTKEF